MPAGQLPPQPSLQHLRKQAKKLHKAVRGGEPTALALVDEYLPRAVTGVGITLSQAQLVVARRYGFLSWRQLRAYLDVVAQYRRSGDDADGGQTREEAARFLHWACAIPPAITDHEGVPPPPVMADVYTAAAVGDPGTMRRLIADDRALANRDGGPFRWPPLLYVAYSTLDGPVRSRLETAQVLLDNGADPNAGFLSDGEPPACTALAGAANYQPRPQLARLLLQAGADANDAYAATHVSDDMTLALLFEYGLGRGDGGPWRTRLGPAQPSPTRLVQDVLLLAADSGLADRVALVLSHCAALGIDIDTAPIGPGRHQRGRTARELAAVGGYLEAERLLATAGARPPQLDPVEQFAAACLGADREAVERLLAGDPTLVERCAHHFLPWRAASLNRTDAIALLAAAGFDLNANLHGTPLHAAAYAGNLAAVQALVRAGADPAIAAGNFIKPGDPTAEIEDPTPLGFARNQGHQEVVDYLAGLTPSA